MNHPKNVIRFEVPNRACDCHMHVYPSGQAMLKNSNTPSQSGTLDEYRVVQQTIGINRCVVVQPTAYGTDNEFTLGAMSALGDTARGVAVVEVGIPPIELKRLDALGMRGARYHSLTDGEFPWDEVDQIAPLMAEIGWHLQFSVAFPELEPYAFAARLSRLPCNIVFDHIGRFKAPVDLASAQVNAMRALLASGRCWIKLSAPYHGSRSGAPAAYDDMGMLASLFVKDAPQRMVWASNWPHTTLKSDFPDERLLLDVLGDWAPDAATRRMILVENPEQLYRFAPTSE